MRREVLIIAHRGASARAPENTLAAVRAAAVTGARMVEVDVQMTHDERLVIFHDDRLERTTNGSGRLARQRYAALARLDAGRWRHPRFMGERIPLLSQLLRYSPRRLAINLELKRTPRRAALLRRLTHGLRRVADRQRLLLSSFDPALLRPLRASALARALIADRDPEASLGRAIRLGCVAWHPHYSLLSRRRVARAHAAGLRVHAWTVDRADQARRLLRLGVDGLFTNDPAALCRALRLSTAPRRRVTPGIWQCAPASGDRRR